MLASRDFDTPSRVSLNEDGSGTPVGLAFYQRDFGVDLAADGTPTGTRSNFVRGPVGDIVWFRSHGRLYRRL